MKTNPKKTINNDDNISGSPIVSFVLNHVDLFIDKNKQVFVRDKGTKEVWPLNGNQFRDWLVSSFFQKHNKIIRSQVLLEVLSALSGIGRSTNNKHDVHIRVATLNGNYYIDLGQKGNSKAIEITPYAWQVIENPPVMFVRPDSMIELNEPIQGAGICLDLLWNLCNIPTDKQILIITYVIECFRPDTPYPLLEIVGEQGSAKSTTQSILRRLVDPHACDLRASPKCVDDLFVAAGVNHLLCYENVSHLNNQIQDGLCVIATGGGFAKRRLYTDIDEIIIHAKNPVMVNGISPIITAPDLIDRTISIELPVISHRKESTSLWETFKLNQSQIFGAILNIFVAAIAILPNIKIPPVQRPRLVEYAGLGMAICNVLGFPQEHFIDTFNQSRLAAIERTLDENPIITALLDWFEAHERKPIEISLHELLVKIKKYQPTFNTEVWPKTSKGFGNTLRRIAPVLRQLGLNIKSIGKRGSYVIWQMLPCESSLKSSLGSLHVVVEEKYMDKDLEDMKDIISVSK